MVWWHAAAWGLAGGAAAGLASLMAAVARAGFSWPERGQFGPRIFVFIGELTLGGLVAAAMHGSISAAWPAFALGIGAPATVRRLLSGVEVSERSEVVTPKATAQTPAVPAPEWTALDTSTEGRR
jgi:hypothetical protein